jgi:4-hydroxy-tetrahydrodipicolinate synthase
MGFAGALVVPPFYYPDIAPDGLLAYVEALVARVAQPQLSLYLYHIPQNTGVPWPLDVVVELKRRHPRALVGLKDSAGDLAYARAVAKTVEDFDVFPSAEGSLGNADIDGFAGCISATTNITGPYAQAGWSAQGTPAGVAAISKASALRALLARQPLIPSVKAAIAMIHKDPGWERLCLPLRSLAGMQQTQLIEDLSQALAN